MRARVGVATALVVAALFGGAGVAACGFGVDLDNLFGAAVDGGPSAEGSVDGGDGGGAEAGIPSLEVQQLAAGDNFTCGRRIDGTVMCWGEDGSIGRLGDGLKFSTSTPVLVKDVADAIDVAAGPSHACIVHKSGTVSCWGENGSRQLGDGTTVDSPTPLNVVTLADATQLALGRAFSCTLKKDATVACWGDNAVGQLGDGTKTPRSQPAPVTGLKDVTQVAAVDATACAVTKAGDVFCWGRNNAGQATAATPADVLAPLKVDGLTGVTSIGLGGTANHFCAVLGTGAIMCWGNGNYGNLGNAKGENSATPVGVLTISDALGATMGSNHACAWRKSGAVACWGLNNWRQLGIGDTAAATNNVSTPLPVETLSGIKQVTGGDSHTCALSMDGKHVSCWGANVGGALGRGTRVVSDVPVKVASASSFVSLTMGASHTCGLDAAGVLSCAGSNELRQYLVKSFLAAGTPAVATGAPSATRAAAGDVHTCVVAAGGQVQCWGNGQYGQLGNGQAPYIQETPAIFTSTAATDVGAGANFSCALLATKEVACTGQNDGLKLGFDSGGSNPSTPSLVVAPGGGVPDAGPDGGPSPTPPLGATKIAISRGHSCVLRAGGIATCWGYNTSGECGVGGAGSTLPVDVPTLSGLLDIAPGGGHTCALLGDGSVRCWGANNFGQTTGGMPDGPALRTPDLGGKTAKAIASGENHSCALTSDGTVLCWGRGKLGQLGNGVRADVLSPAVVKNLPTNAKALFARVDRTCALMDDGSAYCWGNNRIGELGDGAVMTTGAAAPVVGY